MTTPAFAHQVAINADERNPQMTATTVGIEYHRNELQQIATDLRNERTLAASGGRGGRGGIRFTLGLALVNLGTALASGSRPKSLPAR